MNAFPTYFDFATCYMLDKWSKNSWAHCYWCLYLHVTLFIIHVEIQKKIDIVIQMTLGHVLVQRFKRKEIGEKNNFQQRHVNVTKQGNSSRRMI